LKAAFVEHLYFTKTSDWSQRSKAARSLTTTWVALSGMSSGEKERERPGQPPGGEDLKAGLKSRGD
jgi:hypothetical protein